MRTAADVTKQYVKLDAFLKNEVKSNAEGLVEKCEEYVRNNS